MFTNQQKGGADGKECDHGAGRVMKDGFWEAVVYDGFGTAVVMMLLAVAVALFGGLYVAKEVRYECDSFGKTRLMSKLYECKPMPDSK